MKQFFPFRLDPESQRLWRGETVVALRPKAFAILSYLVQHAGRLVSHDELLHALWPDTFVQPDVLKSHILEVRVALGDNPKHPTFIETLPRRGYRFIEDVTEATGDSTCEGQIIGREVEFKRLHEYLRQARSGEQQIVFVTGEAGIGKTTLADVFIKDARERVAGLCIARSQCVEGYGVQEPYYPVLAALTRVLQEKEELVRVLEIHAPTWLAQFPGLLKPEHRQLLQRETLGATRRRMVREFCDVLPLLSAEETLVLVLEDIHWADAATIELIAAIAHSRTSNRLLLVGTYRPVEVVLSQHPLKTVKQDLMIRKLCRELPLESLSEAAVARYLVSQSPGNNLPDGLAGMMHRVSEGNPLFLHAALEHLMARGHLSCTASGWKEEISLAGIEMEVPESLRQMLELQVERLSDDERRALEAASVCGAVFLAQIGAAAADLGLEMYEEICQKLAQRFQVVRLAGLKNLPDGSVTLRCKFSHAFYRKVIYDRLPPQRRSRLHLRVGESLEAFYSGTSCKNPSELALHFEAGGDWRQAAKYLQLAAETKGQRFAYREAASDLEHALELLGKLPAPEGAAARMAVMQKLGALYFALEDFPLSISILETVAVRAAMDRDSLSEINALFHIGFILGRTSAMQSLSIARQLFALCEQEENPVLQARAKMDAWTLRLAVGDWKAQDAQQFRAALAEVRSHLDRRALAVHTAEYSAFRVFSSEYRHGIRGIEESLPVLVEVGDIRHRSQLLVLLLGLVASGDWGQALRVAHDAVTTAEKNENHNRKYALLLFQALPHLFAGDCTGALELCESALPGVQHPDQAMFLHQALVMAGTALVGLGRYEPASAYLLQARERMAVQPVQLTWYWKMLLQSALTDLWLQREDLRQARVDARRFVDASVATGERTWQALAWEADARVALAGSDLQQAQDSIRKAISVMGGFDLPLACWRVHATALQLFPEAAEDHQRIATAEITRLAESLQEFPSLRNTFLSSGAVRDVTLQQSTGSKMGAARG